jgi:hypothetical protein
MKQFILIVSEREAGLLMDALDETLRSLEYYINDGNDETNIEADRQVFNEYSHILSKLDYAEPVKEPVIKPPENLYVDNPDFLEIV